MKTNKLFFFICFIFSVNAFDTSQLPLSDKLKITFPKLNASSFIISNLDCKIVVNELNSDKPTHIGAFNDILISSKINTPQNNKLTLYEMNEILFQILDRGLYNLQIHYENADITIINSDTSGFGCVFSYESKNGGEFIGIIYGCNSKDSVFNDVRNIINWLDQFYVQDISKIKQGSTKVPVLYGEEKTIDLEEQKRKILISKFASGKIERTYRYKTLAAAPIEKGEILGTAFYFSDIFKNPINIPLIASKNMKKSNLLQRIFDTITYIIFGSNI